MSEITLAWWELALTCLIFWAGGFATGFLGLILNVLKDVDRCVGRDQ